MSVNIKQLDGTLKKIAGNTVILDATASEIREGLITANQIGTVEGEGYKTLEIQLSPAMPDTKYFVVFNGSTNSNFSVVAQRPETGKFYCTFRNTISTSVTADMDCHWYAVRLVELEGYTALQNKVSNPDSTPVENSTNLVTSGGVYDAIKNASSIFIGTSSEWESETSKTDYQLCILTDRTQVNAVDGTTGDTTVVANKNLVFKGTLDEWEALTTAEKKTYDEALITNDMDTGEVVNGVTDGDMRAVTSNAVYDAIAQIKTETKARYKALSFNSIPGVTFAKRDNNPKALSATRVDNIIVLNYAITIQGTYTGASNWLPIFNASQLDSLLDDDERLNDSVTPYFCSGITYTNNASYNKLDGVMNGYYLYFYNTAVFDMGIQGQIILGVQKTS